MEKELRTKETIDNEKLPEEVGMKNYNLPPENYLNPGNMEVTSEEVIKNIKGINANTSYRSMMGKVLENEILSKKMSADDVEALAVLMVEEEYDRSENEAQIDDKVMTEEQELNKQEVNKENFNETSVFSRAVETLRDYFVKHPKVAMLAMVGTFTAELGGCAVSRNMVYAGISGMQQSVYAETSGVQQAEYAAMQGKQQAEYAYQREIQAAEQERQRSYSQLDNYILRVRSQGQEKQATTDISIKRNKIEEQYSRRVYNAQINYQRNWEKTAMRVEQIQKHTQMRQQQIQTNTGARLLNQAIREMIQGTRR